MKGFLTFKIRKSASKISTFAKVLVFTKFFFIDFVKFGFLDLMKFNFLDMVDL